MKVSEKLDQISENLRNIRDEQNTIPCFHGHPCTCQKFDLIIDDVENLAKTFKIQEDL